MANVLKKWIESDRRELRRIDKIANRVERYADQMSKLTDEQLQAKTPEFENAIKKANHSTTCCPKPLRLLVRLPNEF